MERLVRDGKVAVVYSADYGSGWYTWNRIEELLYDPGLVQLVLDNVAPPSIVEYCEARWDIQLCRPRLAVAWVPLGARFRIEEYDGAETVMLESDYVWLSA
jgi:hypothetical protein